MGGIGGGLGGIGGGLGGIGGGLGGIGGGLGGIGGGFGGVGLGGLGGGLGLGGIGLGGDPIQVYICKSVLNNRFQANYRRRKHFTVANVVVIGIILGLSQGLR